MRCCKPTLAITDSGNRRADDDADAAGWGWFVDDAADNSEYHDLGRRASRGRISTFGSK